jgi:hypothetical protein
MRTSLLLLALLAPRDAEWAADWTDASRRAREEKKLVLVLVELYGGLTIPERLPALFLVGDLADLKRHRFVGLRWKRGLQAPFQDPSVYGMGPLTFGSALLVATPDGRIVAQTAPHGAFYLDLFLRSVLRKHPEFTGSRVDPAKDPLDRAEAHLRRGELEEAESLLRRPSSARGFRLQASLKARLRRGEEAREAIRNARASAGPDLAAELDVDEGVLLLGLGKPREAAKLLHSVLERSPQSPRAAEARYHLSHILLRDRVADGKAGFEETVRTAGGTPWAKAAEAVLKGGSLETAAYARLEWPAEPSLEVARVPAPRPLPPSEAPRAADAAVRYLLGAQLPDGSWITPASLSSEAAAFTVATTAICARSLRPYRDRKDVAEAIERGVQRVISLVGADALDRQARVFGFGYSIWARALAVRLLARGPGDRAAGTRDRLVRELVRDQSAAGGWTYYAGVDPSFVTATVLLALQEAKEAGAAVPPATLEKGLRCLESARGPRGAFRYFPGGSAPGAEAGPRSPLCALALLRGGRGDPAGVAAGLDRYLEARLEVRKERGKALCHTGPDGTAAYYLLFGYAFAAETLASLPEGRREAYRKAILEDVLAARLEDGSFLDFPAMGRSYGTAMALAALTPQ